MVKKIFSVFLCAFVVSYLFATKAIASSISLLPSEVTTNLEEKLTLSLHAEVKDAIAIQLDLSFDPSILEIESVEKRELFNWLVVIKREGSIRLISGVNLDSPPISSSGRVADISFRAKATGTTILSITNPWIIKPTSEEIPETSGSTVTCTSEEYHPQPESKTPLFWPNPFYPNIHKKLSFSPTIKEARFYNIKGEMVEQDNLSSGVYILILIDSNNRTYLKKLSVVR